MKVGPSTPQVRKEQLSTEQSVLQSQQPVAVLSALARATQERALQAVLVAARQRRMCDARNKLFVPYTGAGTFSTPCELERAVLVSASISFEDAVAHCARSDYFGQFDAFRPYNTVLLLSSPSWDRLVGFITRYHGQTGPGDHGFYMDFLLKLPVTAGTKRTFRKSPNCSWKLRKKNWCV